MMGVLASGDRVAQVLTNLITNALKFTPEGGAVKVRARVIDVRPERSSGGFELGPRIKETNRISSESGYAVQFDVVDTGPGIAPADQARIFQRFSQASSGVAGRAGLGLGLSIAREIVHRHNGRIWLSSEVGKGSVFSFTLPAIED
jgi:signal transduction histidine kinase